MKRMVCSPKLGLRLKTSPQGLISNVAKWRTGSVNLKICAAGPDPRTAARNAGKAGVEEARMGRTHNLQRGPEQALNTSVLMRLVLFIQSPMPT